MKALPKRKGNPRRPAGRGHSLGHLNESPHKSLWKLTICTLNPVGNHDASMKALQKGWEIDSPG